MGKERKGTGKLYYPIGLLFEMAYDGLSSVLALHQVCVINLKFKGF
jgi:hypothetical protein